MNKEWCEANKLMQEQIDSAVSYVDGIDTLLELRITLMNELIDMKMKLNPEDFWVMPIVKNEAHQSMSIAYSIWRTFRIEDIVMHTLITEDQQIFFEKNYQDKIGSPIITTGNELTKSQIEAFSKEINLDALYEYAKDVMESTDAALKAMEYSDLRKKISPQAKINLLNLNCVSKDENAAWLVDYWCSKDVRGLIKMPMSRHWIMHIEAAKKIEDELCK